MRLTDIYWMETRQTRQAKTPDLTETDTQTDAAEVCRRRKAYVPITEEEYDPQTNSLYEDPPCAGTSSDRYVILNGTRYLERSYTQDNLSTKRFCILQVEGEAFTDVVRSMEHEYYTGAPEHPTHLFWAKPDWFDIANDKIEVRWTTSTEPPEDIPKGEWQDETGNITDTFISQGDTQIICTVLSPVQTTGRYALWLYHSTGGADLSSATITENVKKVMVQGTVPFFPMQPLEGYDSSKDLLWVFNGGSKRGDLEIVPCTYEDGGTADFWVFDRGVSGVTEIRMFQSTASPKEDVRGYTTEQVEAGLRDYVIVTENIPNYVCGGCIQTGDTLLTRTPNNTFFEMADGTCACYPAGTAKAEAVLELECTEAQAEAIDRVSNRGELLLAGLRCGASLHEALHPPRTGYRAFLNGQIEIEKMFAGVDAYRVRIPLRFNVSGETYCSVTLPVICPELLTIGSTSEQVRFFPYLPVGGNPVFVRGSTLFTDGNALEFTLTFFRADDAETPLADYTAWIRNSALPTTPSVQTLAPGSLAASCPLVQGLQSIDITISKNGLHALRLRLPVYRQAVMST